MDQDLSQNVAALSYCVIADFQLNRCQNAPDLKVDDPYQAHLRLDNKMGNKCLANSDIAHATTIDGSRKQQNL